MGVIHWMPSRAPRPRTIVIGGSEGIGRAVAGELVARGSDVTITGRRADVLQVAMHELRLGDGHALCFDFTDAPATSRELGNWINSSLDPFDIVICPGVTIPGLGRSAPLDDYRAMMEINFFAYVVAIQTVWPGMRARGGGSIVAMASALGVMGAPGYSGYCASKFALLGLLDSLQGEALLDGIRLHCICPAAVDTPGFRHEKQLKSEAMLAFELSTGLLPATRVARSICRGIRRRRFIVHPGLRWSVAEWLGRMLPGVRRAIVNHSAREIVRDAERR